MASGSKKQKKHEVSHDDDHHVAHHHAEHAEEGEPWLVSYADMMTLLFGFFVVMYSFAARDPKIQECISLKLMEAFKEQKPDLNEEIKGSTTQGAAVRALQMLVSMMNLESVEDLIEKVQTANEKRDLPDESQSKSSSDIADQLKEKSSVESLKALLGADDSKNLVTIALPADALFESGTANLSRKSAVSIEEIAGFLRSYSEIEDIQVAGHTDSQTSRSHQDIDNWTLSVQRAAKVGQILIASGLPKNIIKIYGRGDSTPLFPEKSASGQWISENMRRNRRIEIQIKREPTSAKLNKK